MIKCENGTLEIAGKLPELAAELEIILRVFRNASEKSLGKNGANLIMEQILEESKKDLDMRCKEQEKPHKEINDIGQFSSLLRKILEPEEM